MGRFAPADHVDPHWVPRLPELGFGSSAWRQYTDRRQGERRERTSLSRRSPVETPDLANSPTISRAEVMSSVAPGGWTLSRVPSPSDSNPCRGTGPPRRARLALAAARGLAAELRTVFRLPWPAPRGAAFAVERAPRAAGGPGSAAGA